MSLLALIERRDEEERTIQYPHDEIIETLVAGGGEPPFEGEDQAEDFEEVEGGDEDVFVRGADELEGFLREEGHVFVCCVVGYVFVGGVVEGDEDVEENYGIMD